MPKDVDSRDVDAVGYSGEPISFALDFPEGELPQSFPNFVQEWGQGRRVFRGELAIAELNDGEPLACPGEAQET